MTIFTVVHPQVLFAARPFVHHAEQGNAEERRDGAPYSRPPDSEDEPVICRRYAPFFDFKRRRGGCRSVIETQYKSLRASTRCRRTSKTCTYSQLGKICARPVPELEFSTSESEKGVELDRGVGE